jgi:hypothetical protein
MSSCESFGWDVKTVEFISFSAQKRGEISVTFVQSASQCVLITLFCFNQACETADSESEASEGRTIETPLLDEIAPEWPDQAILTQRSISESAVSISWPKYILGGEARHPR